MTTLTAGGSAVLSALLLLRGRPAALTPELEGTLPVHASAEAAAAALGAALSESASGPNERPPADAGPASRFLHRYRRRGLSSPAPQVPGPPAAALRLAGWLPPGAADLLARATAVHAAAEADRVETRAAERRAAARGLRLELRRLSRARQAHIAATHEAALALAVALAERLVGAHLALCPDDLVGLLRGALAGGLVEVPANVRVHPDSVDAVRAALGENAIVIVADPGLKPGDLMIETVEGRQDARLCTRLAALLTS